MRLAKGRKWAIAGGLAVLLGAYGFIQSRGGWSEVTQMPAKRDESTPAIQNGFELLGIARVTEAERSPRLVLGDLDLGGSTGPVGSTRLWVRLPPSQAGSAAKMRALKLEPTVRFPNGDVYPSTYEMADVENWIASVLIPAGHPPVDWVELELKVPGHEGKWRLRGVPKTPAALPNEGKTTFEVDGVKVTAIGRSQGRFELNRVPEKPEEAGATIDFRVDFPREKKGEGAQVNVTHFVPEYLHPADLREPSKGGTVFTREYPTGVLPVNFPYADGMRRIGLHGKVEFFEVDREPIAFKGVTWKWFPIRKMGMVPQLSSEFTRLPDGSRAYVAGSLNEARAAIFGYWQSAGGSGVPSAPFGASIVDLQVEKRYEGWQQRLQDMRRGKEKPKELSLGIVNGFVERKRIVRTVPFELLVPMKPRSE